MGSRFWMINMQGSQKSKRVSWASDGNLCQVRLFLSEDSPSQVGVGAQDHLQIKKNVSGVHVNGLVADDNLPPGFEGFNPVNQLKNRIAQIPVVKWQAPPKFTLNGEWLVASGLESKEVEIQNQRELREFESFYLRPSAIPPNPAVSSDVECAIQDERTLPVVPITPIEEEDLSGDQSSDFADFAAPTNVTTSANPLLAPGNLSSSQSVIANFNSGSLAAGVVNGGQEDALKAALTAIAKSNEQIDHNLLVKILSNPTIVQQLVTQQEQGPGIGSQSVLPKPVEPSRTNQKPLSLGTPVYKVESSYSPARQYNHGDCRSSASAMMSNGILYHYTNGTGPMTHQQMHGVIPQVPPVHSGSASHVKDLNYYKNLIQQHGGERQAEPQSQSQSHPQLQPPFSSHPIHHSGIDHDVVDNSKPKDIKPKIMKPCMYFNTSKGCRHGDNCIYQHDMSFQQRDSSISEMQSAKRMRMDREVRGSQSYS